MIGKRRILTGTGMALAMGLLAGAAHSAELQWNAAIADWFDGANWSPASVPGAGDDAFVNNAGTAIVDSVSPLYPGGNASASSLNIGASMTGAGSLSGAVISNNVGFSLSGTSVGVAGDAITQATGSFSTTGAGVAAGALTVGSVNSSAANASAQGTMTIGGVLAVSNATIGSALSTGASAQGAVSAQGGSGGGPGSGFVFIGQAQGAGAQATGQLQVTGSSSFTAPVLNIGSASNGAAAQGRMLLDTAAGDIATSNGFLVVGTSFGTGPSSGAGELSAHAYTLSNSSTFIGVSDGAGNSATGTVALSQLNWSTGVFPSTFSIGIASNGASATGQVTVASGSISGPVGTFVGQSSGDGSVASGQLNAGTLAFGSTSGLSIGSASGGTATGVVTVEGISGLSGVGVGSASHFLTTDTSASGQLTVGSGGVNAPGAQMFIGTASSTALTGNHTATGVMTVAGGTVAAANLTIGSTSGAASANGSYAQTGGTFTLESAPQFGGTVSVGTTLGGHATGAFELTGVAAQVGGLIVGTDFDASGAAGTHSGTGVATLRNSSMTAGFVFMAGRSFFGDPAVANGTLNLINSTLELTGPTPQRPFDGFFTMGNGRGVARLEDSTLKAAEGVQIGTSFPLDSPTAELILIRSTIETDGFVVLGDSALLEIGIEGALRGAEYGAIDANAVGLDGDLKLVFDFLPSLSSYIFDIIMTLGGISGDFDNVLLVDLPTGYAASYGIVHGADGDIYRVTLAQVPEPATLALLLLGLTGLAAARRRGAM